MSDTESGFLRTDSPGDLRAIARARRLTYEYYAADPDDAEKRREILARLFGGFGENVLVDRPIHVDHGDNVFLGNNVVVNMNCTFIDNARITIGDNVLIAPGVQFCTAAHPVRAEERLVAEAREGGSAWFRTYARPITVGNGVWIGAGSIVLPGVAIGDNAVIGAGSVVTRSIPANCVAVGQPCRVIRRLDEESV